MLKTSSLTPESLAILVDGKTEAPHQGLYNIHHEKGTYLCRQCGLALFRSDSKFLSSCGWPAFDDDVTQNVLERPDKDGSRTEIVCHRCLGHLGHLFRGECFTAKNKRYCVNSLSLDFVDDLAVKDTREFIVAGGCFWGVEALLKTIDGVIKTEVGYTGGHKSYPSYEEVCHQDTGHYEAMRIIYDTQKTSDEDVLKAFFEAHDFSAGNGKHTPKKQYQSAIFYFDEAQKNTATALISYLENKEVIVTTKLLTACTFWTAEAYHQDFHAKNPSAPVCSRRTKWFD